MFWENKRVLLTGGYGFLGSQVYRQLIKQNCQGVIRFHRSDYDLTRENDVKKLFNDYQDIEIVIHLAADIGGIGYTRKYPARILYNNLLINSLLQHYSYLNRVKKFVGIGSVCSYPKYTSKPFQEKDLWEGYPEETNASYGIAKKVLLAQSIAYRQQYGFNGIHLLIINLYGPGDNFDLENSHVIPAIIRKMIEARERGINQITAWGDGTPTREFLYVDDCARGILLAAELYDQPEAINLGSGEEISIRKLLGLIAELTGYQGKVEWDKSRPNGQPARCLDVSRARQEFGFAARVGLKEGLQATIDWYIQHRPG